MGTTRRKAAVFTLLAVALIATLLTLSGCLGTEPNKYTIKYFASAGGELVGNQWQTVNEGGNATKVTAVPKEGFMFDKWSDGKTTAERTDTGIKADMEAIAQFKTAVLSVSYIATDRGEIIGEATQQVEYGGGATAVTAVAKDGFRFAGWSDGVSTAMRQDNNIADNLKVTALFNKDTKHNIKYFATTATGTIVGNKDQSIWDGSDGESVEAVPLEGCVFSHWSDGLTTAVRQEKSVRESTSYTAYFSMIMFKAKYNSSEGGIVRTSLGDTVQQNKYASARVIPNKEYNFVGWSDGVTSTTRQDLITADFEVTALFKRKEFAVTYSNTEGGRVAGLLDQTIKYGSDATEVTAIPDAGYEFLSWSDGVMTPTRKETAVNREIKPRAAFAKIGGDKYTILMVFVTELHVELPNNQGEIFKRDYIMTQTERLILEEFSRRLTAILNDLLDGTVKFVIDNYFTTKPIKNENMQWGSDSGFYSYGLLTRDIPEVNDIWESYGSTITIFGMNDYDNKLHSVAGSAMIKECYVHFESVVGSRVANNTPLEELLDFSLPTTYDAYYCVLELFLHELSHTIEKQCSEYFGLHNALYKLMTPTLQSYEIVRQYLSFKAIYEGENIGIPPLFWREWSAQNP